MKIGPRTPRGAAAAWLMAAAAGAGLLVGCGAPEGPRLVFDSVRQDAGRVDAGGSTAVTYGFRNGGDEILRVAGVDVECGCTAPEFTEMVAPGARGEVRVRFSAQPQWRGEVTRSLHVRSNDRRDPRVTLVLAADVVPMLEVDPLPPVVVEYQPGQTTQEVVRLVPRRGAFDVTRAESKDPRVQAALEPVTGAGRTYQLKMTVKGPPTGGDFKASVELTTTEPTLPIYVLTVSAVAAGGPVVNPDTLSLQMIPMKGPQQVGQVVEVFTRGGRLPAPRIETGDPALSAQVDTREPGRSYSVRFRYNGGWKPGLVSGRIRLHFDAPSPRTVFLPFSGQVTAG